MDLAGKMRYQMRKEMAMAMGWEGGWGGVRISRLGLMVLRDRGMYVRSA